MDINNLATDTGDEGYYSEGFRNTISTMIPYLRNNFNYMTFIPNNLELVKYNGDLIGYLDYKGIAKKYHFATLLFNNMKSFSDFNTNTVSVLIPDTNEIDVLFEIYSTSATAIA